MAQTMIMAGPLAGTTQEATRNRMFETTQTPQALTFRLSSDRRKLGRLLTLSATYLKAQGARQTPRFLIVLRELVLNAITHGNRNDPGRLLVCRIIRDRRRDRFVISVQDGGAGFDYRSLDMALPENPAGIHRRGYILVNQIADLIRFNKAGNRVTAFLSNRPARPGGPIRDFGYIGRSAASAGPDPPMTPP